MTAFQPIIFNLGDELYGINIINVRAIEQTQTIVRVPNSSSNIKGIINLRGEVIPVIDLKAKFGLGGTDNGQHELIIVNNKDRKIALEVDVYRTSSTSKMKISLICRMWQRATASDTLIKWLKQKAGLL